MKDFFVAFGLLVWIFHFVCGAPISSIHCGNFCSASTGNPYTLTCMYSGTLGAGITWTKDTVTVLTCNAGGTCVPSVSGYCSGNYPNSSSAILTITSYDRTTDSGTWQCRDGSETPMRCSLPNVDPAKGTLQGSCVKNGSNSIIQCLEITSHGSPAVSLTVKEGTTELKSTTTAGSISVTQTNAHGKTFTCEVTGEAALCLSTTSIYVTCPESTTTPKGAGATNPSVRWLVLLSLFVLSMTVF